MSSYSLSPEEIIERAIGETVIPKKELREYTLSKNNARDKVTKTVIGASVAGGITVAAVSNAIPAVNSFKDGVNIEHTSPEHKIEVNQTRVKDEIIASPSDYGEQFYSKTGKELVATVTKSEADVYDNTMNRPVSASTITKIKSVGVEKGHFNPYVSYHVEDNAKVYATDSGKVVKVKGDSVYIKHTKDHMSFVSVTTGVANTLKVDDHVKQGEVIGKAASSVVKLAVAKEFNGSEAYEFVHPNKFVDIKTSENLNYKTGKVETPKVETSKGEVKQEVKQEVAKETPTVSNKVTSSEEEVVKTLPYGQLILDAGKKYDVDPVLIASIIKQESNFNSKAVSVTNAKGLMQLVSGTARQMGVTDRLDPAQSIDGGTKYLKLLIEQFDGDVNTAIYAYNGGPGRVGKYVKQGLSPSQFTRVETKEYGPKVLNHYKDFVAKANATAASTSSKKQEEVHRTANTKYKLHQTTLPNADYKQWVVANSSDVNVDDLDPEFLKRLAALGQHYGKKVRLKSGYRSIEEQAELYKAYQNGTGNLAAEPGHSNHNFATAADAMDWVRELPESEMLKFGLCKPVSTEDWHIEPVETRGKVPTNILKEEKDADSTSKSEESKEKAEDKASDKQNSKDGKKEEQSKDSEQKVDSTKNSNDASAENSKKEEETKTNELKQEKTSDKEEKKQDSEEKASDSKEYKQESKETNSDTQSDETKAQADDSSKHGKETTDSDKDSQEKESNIKEEVDQKTETILKKADEVKQKADEKIDEMKKAQSDAESAVQKARDFIYNKVNQ